MRQFFLAVLAWAAPAASAQFIPWSESLSPAEAPEKPPPGLGRRSRPAAAAERKVVAAAPAPSVLEAPGILQSLSAFTSVLISSFSALSGSGAVIANTSWVGNVQQNSDTIVVGGTAADDNGWGARGLSLDASGMNFLTITGQRDAGNQAPSLFVQFEDRNLSTQVFSVSTSQFALGMPTVVQIPLGGWTGNFGFTDITGWSIGGGSVGTLPFRMTFDEFSLAPSAIPEPSTCAASFGAAALGFAVWRRRRKRTAARTT